jgi:solute carrier family 39 (zinc transporter), member 1/2/3
MLIFIVTATNCLTLQTIALLAEMLCGNEDTKTTRVRIHAQVQLTINTAGMKTSTMIPGLMALALLTLATHAMVIQHKTTMPTTLHIPVPVFESETGAQSSVRPSWSVDMTPTDVSAHASAQIPKHRLFPSTVIMENEMSLVEKPVQETREQEREVDKCATLEGNAGATSLGTLLAGIATVLAISLAGTAVPLIGKRLRMFNIESTTFQSLKLFGAGVIFATSYVHMFIPAMESLNHPCLEGVLPDYSGLAGVFALAGALFVQLIQLLASKMITASEQEETCNHATDTELDGAVGDGSKSTSPLRFGQHDHDSDDHVHSLLMLKEKHVGIYLLEFGLASHSVLIGITLGVARDEFTTLLIALCFHQFFEGIALSSTLMEAEMSKMTGAAMLLIYSLGTPLGIALGGVMQSSCKFVCYSQPRLHESLLIWKINYRCRQCKYRPDCQRRL